MPRTSQVLFVLFASVAALSGQTFFQRAPVGPAGTALSGGDLDLDGRQDLVVTSAGAVDALILNPDGLPRPSTTLALGSALGVTFAALPSVVVATGSPTGLSNPAILTVTTTGTAAGPSLIETMNGGTSCAAGAPLYLQNCGFAAPPPGAGPGTTLAHAAFGNGVLFTVDASGPGTNPLGVINAVPYTPGTPPGCPTLGVPTATQFTAASLQSNRPLIVADLNVDGLADLLVTVRLSPTQAAIELVLQGAVGIFTPTTVNGGAPLLNAVLNASAVPLVADFNNDTFPDVLVTSVSGLGDVLFVNTTVGVGSPALTFFAATLPAAMATPAGGSNYRSIATGDVDYDGDLDVFGVTFSGGISSITLALNQFAQTGTVGFAAPTTFGGVSGAVTALSAFSGDFDLDADADLAVLGSAGTTVFLNQAFPSFPAYVGSAPAPHALSTGIQPLPVSGPPAMSGGALQCVKSYAANSQVTATVVTAPGFVPTLTLGQYFLVDLVVTSCVPASCPFLYVDPSSTSLTVFGPYALDPAGGTQTITFVTPAVPLPGNLSVVVQSIALVASGSTVCTFGAYDTSDAHLFQI